MAAGSTGVGGDGLAGLVLLGLHRRLLLRPESVEGLARKQALPDQLVPVEGGDGGVVLDARVHQGLGVAGLVGLVVPPPPVAHEVDDHVLVEPLPVLEGEARDVGDRFGIVAVHVEGGGVDHLRDVGGVGRAAGVLGQGREADLVVDDDVDGAARAVAVELGEVHRLRHDPLPREGGVAVQEQGQDVGVLAVPDRVLPGPGHSLDHGVHGLEVARVRGEVHRDPLPRVRDVGPRGPEVVLHVARALVGGRVALLELGEDLGERLADGVGEDVQAAPVGHAHHDLAHPDDGGVGEEAVEEGDERLPALEGEALVADVAGVEEPLEALGGDELLEDPPAALRVEGRIVAGGLHVVLEPDFSLGVGDVHVLDADRSAVGFPEDLEDLAQRRPVPPRERPGQELPVEVPEGEVVGGGFEVGVGGAAAVEGIEVGDEVPPHAVGVDELEDLRLLLDLLAAARSSEQRGVDVHLPAHGAVREVQVVEEALVEPVLALEQLLHPRQEEPRLRPLDDAVVVGRRYRHHLADPEQPQGAWSHRAVLGRVVEGSGRDDHALPRHEPGRRGRGAHGAGVGEGDGRAHEVVGGDGAPPRAGDEVVEGPDELREVQLLGLLDVGNEEGARAVLPLHVHRDPEAHLVALDAMGLTLHHRVGVVQPREGVEGPEDGPGHHVGEADLPLPQSLAVLVEEAAVLLEGAHGDLADGARGGDGEARLHVLDDPHRPAPDGLEDVAGQDRRAGHRSRAGRHLAARERLPLGRGRRRGGTAFVDDDGDGRRLRLGWSPGRGIEVRPPARVDAAAVPPVLLEHVEGEDVVSAEIPDQPVDQGIRRRGAHPRSLERAKSAVQLRLARPVETLWRRCGEAVDELCPRRKDTKNAVNSGRGIGDGLSLPPPPGVLK
jgi:hypothetical protein